ncbi:MAG: hypothetical protein E6J62_01225 [Deltaproteobacteria bacterium]|nr:MAG: hypothetical protein E6J62_01225 [Deltaproteobacteria bacterium]
MTRFYQALCAGLFAAAVAGSAFALEPDELPAAGGLKDAGVRTGQQLNSRGFRSKIGQGHTNSGVTALDTLPNWNGHFNAQGIDIFGNPQVIWYYNMMGNRPELGGTTTINAPIIPVDVDLRNFDGSPRFVGGKRLISHVAPFVQPTLQSPVFTNAKWSSSPVPTQVTDAVQRAEFFQNAKSDWHTLLNPTVKTTRTMVLIRGTYQFALNSDGTCCAFILVDSNTFVNKLFPPTEGDPRAIIGQAQAAGEMTTNDFTTLLFPNTFLFDSAVCCILGFHSFDFEVPNKAFVMNYSSWISPGLFGDAFTDVTAVSHEVAEAYNDPLVSFDLVHNITPWWEAPNGLCQNNLETGDVIEGLPNATFPVTMPNGFTYHPQNEALLQWFIGDPKSKAINGAFSYPDTTVLPTPAAPQPPGCNQVP